MKTYMANDSLPKEWYVVDGEGKTFGRVASQVAAVLIGKHKPIYTPHVDTGDYVIVVNADKLVFTGKKLVQKVYRTHSGYPGHLKEIQYKDMMDKKPEFTFREAVRRMLPKNKLGASMLEKLFVYSGAEHKHQAQQPKPLELKG